MCSKFQWELSIGEKCLIVYANSIATVVVTSDGDAGWFDQHLRQVHG